MNRTKNMTFRLLSLLLCMGMLNSCDRIDDPHPEGSDFDLSLFPGDPADYPFPDIPAPESPVKNVLLEDYTGHKCVPCVAAAVTAENIALENEGRVNLVGIHASPSGNFQQVDSEHPTDFTTEAGDTYVSEMTGVDFNPVGTTNRALYAQSFGQESIWQLESFWNTNVQNQLNTPLQAELQVEINYFEETGGLFVHSRVDFMSTTSGRYNVVHYLIRDEVESPQSTTSGVDEDYVHHHVLSKSIGGPWGLLLVDGQVESGSTYTNELSYPLAQHDSDPTYMAENLSLISYIIDRESFEVLQSVQNKILP